jgi:hypothetical protein
MMNLLDGMVNIIDANPAYGDRGSSSPQGFLKTVDFSPFPSLETGSLLSAIIGYNCSLMLQAYPYQ